MSEMVERAKALAYRAHAWQADKAGRPYIEHVARIAAAVADDPEAEAAYRRGTLLDKRRKLMADWAAWLASGSLTTSR